ncbi:MAG: hypothetical protein [Arizlama microvirus]|nr:MAG: hypothetical protein [Arizlama microvirus]
MMSDTLNYCAQSSAVQQFAVIIQGLMLILGAVINLFGKKKQ